MKLLKIILPFIIVVALSYWAIKPLLISGFFPMHDNTQVARVFEMTKSLRDDMFPVRWVSDLGYGYGYPIFNFYAPLVYYVGAIFQLLGLDALIATKLMMGVGIILSGVFMYLLGKEFWGKLGGIVSAAFYLYAPYHAVDIYVRGDVAEFWAYAFIPAAFLGFYKVFKSKGNFGWVIFATFSYAGIIVSHNLTAMIVTPFLLAMVLIFAIDAYRSKNLSIIRNLLAAISLGLSLSAFYFIPALLEQKYTNVLSQIGGGADFKDHFVCPLQLWQSQWGYGGSAPGCVDGLSFMIGKAHLLLVLAVLIIVVALIFIKKIKKDNKQVVIIGFSILGLLISIVMMLPISKLLWDKIPLMAFLQYPWRFLLMASFFASLLSGTLVYFSKLIFNNKYLEYLTFGFLVLLVIFLSLKFFIPQAIFSTTANDFTNEATLKWTTSKISDEYMPRDFPKPTSVNNVVNNTVSFNNQDIKINSSKQTTKDVILDLDAVKQTKLHFNIAYFPSWRLTVDGNSQGSIISRGYDVVIPAGHHIVEMKFVESIPQILADLLTVSGLVVILIGIILRSKKVIYG